MKIHGALLAALLLVLAQLGCSRAASRVVADALSSGAGNVYGSDDDPELVRDAVPFGLKTLEALLERHPEHEGLLLSLASGFTQYTFAFVDSDADALEMAGKSAQARPVRERARHLYLRARDYGLRGLEARHKGSAAKLREIRDLDPTLGALNKDDVPLVYWTAASWALAIGSGLDDMALVAQLPAPGALMQRALALDETWDHGAIHEFFVSWEPARGASPEAFASAKRHLDRALELSQGKRLGPVVAYAEAVCVPKQDRAEFSRLLREVLTADVQADRPNRLANVLAQRRARMLLDHADDLFT
ncbi:MAG TPA: TRAP transporter TatT component family protein [Anaeromyxobacteraceae bacterium]|nr:TRAP transporter TatT component family protein [Anaeromyxobacteraceae bacterium]